VRVCCGDWKRVLTDAPTINHGLTGVFLDPPYAFAANRDPDLYSKDDAAISTGVREWAIAHGDDPQFRIALCGYEDEHEMPESWKSVAWKASGGMSNTSQDEDTQGKRNRHRERVWLSPHCFDVTGHPEIEPGKLESPE
jgi:DNA adenine methylase